MGAYFTACELCGADTSSGGRLSKSRLCLVCRKKHDAECRRAVVRVRNAIASGKLPHASTQACADCGQAARIYDHRDYTEPLKVEPVCTGCNVRRGRAFNSFYRPEAR